MHEYHLLEKILKSYLADNQKEVSEIVLAVSDTSGLDPDSMNLYFEQIKENNLQLKNAALIVQSVKTELYCPKCNLDFQRIQKSFTCPKCSTESRRSSLQKDVSIVSLKFKA